MTNSPASRADDRRLRSSARSCSIQMRSYLYRGMFADEAEMEAFLAEVCTSDWVLEADRGRPFAQGCAELAARFPRYRGGDPRLRRALAGHARRRDRRRGRLEEPVAGARRAALRHQQFLAREIRRSALLQVTPTSSASSSRRMRGWSSPIRDFPPVPRSLRSSAAECLFIDNSLAGNWHPRARSACRRRISPRPRRSRRI